MNFPEDFEKKNIYWMNDVLDRTFKHQKFLYWT